MTRQRVQQEQDKGLPLPSLEAGPTPNSHDATGSRAVTHCAVGVCLAILLTVAMVLGTNFPRHDITTPVALAAEVTPANKPETSVVAPAPKAQEEPAPPSAKDKTADSPVQPVTEAAADEAANEAPVAPAEAVETSESAEVAEPAKQPEKAAPKPTTSKKNPSIKLFGTVEFRGTLKGVPSWTSVLERNKKKPLLVAGAKLNASTGWDDFKKKLTAMPPMEQLKAVNRFWNQWPYRLDPEVYKKPDYWATPDEFRRNSGDCEDYSIAKYYTLKEVGISPDDMRIVVLMETIRNIAHAVLVVYVDGDAWVLDNLSNSVLSHSRYKNYAPQFSVNEKFRWAHVRPK